MTAPKTAETDVVEDKAETPLLTKESISVMLAEEK
jgi:hypothetical protein